MISTPSLLRRAEHEALSGVTLSGSVLDLGGEKCAEYITCIHGNFTVTTVNLDSVEKTDIVHDLEEPIPLADASYDHVLLINVLEHIFNYRQLLTEATRIVRPGGSVIIAVPFLFPIHPSPHDYWRFTKETLEKECVLAGLQIETLTPLGSGVFAVRYMMLDRLLPAPLRFVSYYTFRYIASALDSVFSSIAHVLGKRYSTAEYALGYVVYARNIYDRES